jgi:hypothetical protein
MSRKSRALPPSPFRRFNSSPEVIRLVVMMYVRFPLSLRNVEDLLFERGIDICHEGTVKATRRPFADPVSAVSLRTENYLCSEFSHYMSSSKFDRLPRSAVLQTADEPDSG